MLQKNFAAVLTLLVALVWVATGFGQSAQAPCLITVSEYGPGFPGTNGIPQFTATLSPGGDSLELYVGNSSGLMDVAAFLYVSTDSVELPDNYQEHADPTLIGDPTETDVEELILDPDGATYDLILPDTPTACGETLFLQVVQIDDGAIGGMSYSAGLQVTFGVAP